ncbi:GIY-YIG nuclease family protein [Flavisolibacter ginsengisoli]|jgi:hypothetical protein|nr:hypothetical protein [Flavisolibacter ginsengisoli]
MINITASNCSVNFILVPIEISKRNVDNVFAHYSRRTLEETYEKARKKPTYCYNSVLKKHGDKYSKFFKQPLGHFIKHLKEQGNLDYKLYLNKYGDEKYCSYCINSYLKDKGLYCYYSEGQVKYVGRCKTSFKSRINGDYGSITSYNCLLDGQATNCHLNSIINSTASEIFLGIHEMSEKSSEEIEQLERTILSNKRFEWNIQLQKESKAANMVFLQ